MNKERRRLINVAVEILKDVLSDEEDYYDNIPENLQSSQRADDSSDAIDALNDAIEMLEDII